MERSDAHALPPQSIISARKPDYLSAEASAIRRSPTIASSRRPCRRDFVNQFQVPCHLGLSSLSPARLQLKLGRWAAVACEQVFVWVRFTVLRACSARRAVLLGEPLRALLANRRTQISIGPFCVVRRSFVALNSGSPTPRCNRRPWRGVQDRADFMGKLVPFIVFVLPGARLNFIRWAALQPWRTTITLCVLVLFA